LTDICKAETKVVLKDCQITLKICEENKSAILKRNPLYPKCSDSNAVSLSIPSVTTGKMNQLSRWLKTIFITEKYVKGAKRGL